MPKRQTITWVAAIDGEKAHFFTKGAERRLNDLNHTLTARPIRTNNETRRVMGRVHDRIGSARHIVEPHMDDRTQEKRVFAEEVAEYLEGSLAKQKYNRLIVVAPPKLLGVLRKALNKPVKNTIVLELDKDFAHLSPEQIQEHLEKIMPIQEENI